MSNGIENKNISLLYVDDEDHILRAMKRQLRKKCPSWTVYYANNSNEAMTVVKENYIDVVITDLNMPDQNGVTLLNEIERLQKDSVRIILSGNTCDDALLNTLLVAHQFIPKPFKVDELIENIERIINLKSSINNQQIISKLTSSNSIPVLPDAFHEVINAINDDDVSLSEVANLIEQDVGMLTKILQIVNSAFFGLSRNITTIQEAVSYLGIDFIRAIFITKSMFDCCDEKLTKQFLLEQSFSRSLQLGEIAANIAMQESDSETVISYCRLSGLLSEVGIVVLAKSDPSYLTQLFKGDNCTLNDVISFLGAYMLQLWSFPIDIIEAVAYFKKPSQLKANRGSDKFTPTTALHLANYIYLSSISKTKAREFFDENYIKQVQLSNDVDEYINLFSI